MLTKSDKDPSKALQVLALFLLSIIYCKALLGNTKIEINAKKLRKIIDQKSCEYIIAKKLPQYKKLYQLLSNKKNEHPIVSFLDMGSTECQSLKMRKQLQIALGSHSKKIGILLPDNRSYHTPVISQSMDYAVKNYFENKNLDIEKHAVIKKYGSSLRSLELKVAQLVFQTGVGIIVGGISRAHETYLIDIGRNLEIPVIITRPKKEPSLIDRQVFHVSPSSGQMVDFFLNFLKQKGVQRLAILHPTQSNQEIIDTIQSKFKSKHLIAPTIIHYIPDSFSSIENALKNLFQIKQAQRADEMKNLIATHNINSDTATEDILLPPIVNVDAIMILDNFRNARHIISVVKYLNVSNMMFIGNQQWRSSELFNPPEPMLKRSFFIDYIGKYNELPFGLDKYAGAPNPWFLPLEKSEAVDIKLIMTAAVDSAYRALQATNKPRYKLYQSIEKISPADQSFFTTRTFFDKHHNSRWPFYIFSLDQDKLRSVHLASKK